MHPSLILHLSPLSGLHVVAPGSTPDASFSLCVKSAPDGYKQMMDIFFCRSDLPASVSHKRGRCLQGLGPYLFCPKQMTVLIPLACCTRPDTPLVAYVYTTPRPAAVWLPPPVPLPTRASTSID